MSEQQPMTPAGGPVETPPEKPKMPVGIAVICAWPIGLAAVGGLVGGLLGGLAYGLNTLAYNKGVKPPALIGVSIVTGAIAIGGWLAVVGAIR